MRRLHLSPRRVALLAAATLGLGSAGGYAASLGVASWHVWGGSQTLTKGTCTLSGTGSTFDTYVLASSPTSNHGSNSTMQIDPTADGSPEWAFVRFDLSSCNLPATGGANSATITLTITNAPNASRTLTVTPVYSNWAETLNWNQAQSLSYGTPTTTFATGTSTGRTLSFTVTVDVDALIKNSSASYGWRISDGDPAGSSASKDRTAFDTSEAGSGQPSLAISYEK